MSAQMFNWAVRTGWVYFCCTEYDAAQLDCSLVNAGIIMPIMLSDFNIHGLGVDLGKCRK